ncbi:response regulator transcription factor [Paenibacillus pinihumi]|uniref:response regulator transcription factor n=1 Tax=Paenibacillus pinihumi TaxID=669462 RepID=UPI0004127EA8|nr:response regulator transcription factor [Paenibacillus pinihumi]
MIAVLIVEDDPFIRESLKLILDLEADLEVVGICGNGYEAVEFVRAGSQVDVVLMDIRMPECDGVEATRLLKELERPPSVIILTTFDDDDYIVEAIRHGAGGYLLKNVPPARIVSAIKTVHGGELLIHPDIARKLADMISSRDRQETARPGSNSGVNKLAEYGLNDAEKDIIRLVSDGKSNREIAGTLFLSEGTVKNYISSILDKLELRDRTQIAIFYLKLTHGGMDT